MQMYHYARPQCLSKTIRKLKINRSLRQSHYFKVVIYFTFGQIWRKSVRILLLMRFLKTLTAQHQYVEKGLTFFKKSPKLLKFWIYLLRQSSDAARVFLSSIITRNFYNLSCKFHILLFGLQGLLNRSELGQGEEDRG